MKMISYPKTALYFAYISEQAYDYTGDIFEFTALDIFKSKLDTQVLVGYSGNELIVAFSGTDSIRDWLMNLLVYKKVIPYDGVNPKIKVHAGFIESYKLVRPVILKVAKHHKPRSIVCTGHSLGGVIANLCAVDLQYNTDSEIACFTYGAPRPGNEEFSRSYNGRVMESYNFINGADIIPFIPFIFSWRKVGHLERISHVTKFNPKVDHSIKEYIRKLERML